MGRILAVPVRMLAQLVGFLRISDPLFLWSVVWKLSRQARDGSQLLLLICGKEGIEVTRSKAEEMLEECRSSELAATIGWIEVRSSGENISAGYDSAMGWIKRAKREGFEKPEMLLDLELFVRRDDAENYERVIEEILSYNDLPMEFSRAALVAKALLLEDFEDSAEAEKIADRVLSIEEDFDLRLIKWMNCLKRGEHAEAEKHLAKAKKADDLTKEFFDVVVAERLLFLGRKQEAMERLYKAKQDGFKFTEKKSEIWALANSSEFEEFCKEREG